VSPLRERRADVLPLFEHFAARQEGAVPSQPRSLQQLVERLERDAIAEALQAAGGKKIRAAERLGISRPTLDKKIEEYAIPVDKSRRS
jgi:DNA-binding NtrC family response regulator